MKLILILAAAASALASPAAAEFGKAPAPSGFQKPKAPVGGGYTPSKTYDSTPKYGVPRSSAAPSNPSSTYGSTMHKSYGAPQAATPYKLYEPYKSQPSASIFGPDGKKKP